MWPASTPGRPSDLAIEAEGGVKRFGKVEALSGLGLVAHRGQVAAVEPAMTGRENIHMVAPS
jgi:hypothetical protein